MDAANKSVQLSTEYVQFEYNISTETTDRVNLHCHNFYELYFFLDGDVDYLVEGLRYAPAPESLMLFAPHVFHGVKVNSKRPYRRFSLHFYPEILSPSRRELLLSVFDNVSGQTPQDIYYEQGNKFGLQDYFAAIRDCSRMAQDEQESLVAIYLEALLARILFMRKSVMSSSGDSTEIVSRVIGYLNRNLQEQVTLDEIAERFFISKSYLNKMFKKATGTTVINYLLRKRVTYAQELLAEGCAAQEAAREAGFSDYSSFYRSYIRLIGHPPIRDKGGSL